MMIYRCTACTRDHATAQQPAICEGCHLAAGNFAVIHLAEVIDADFTDVELEAGRDDDGVRLDERDDAPATPRDKPEGEGAEPAEVSQLRPVVAKREGICGQATCDAPATHRFTWPGHPESPACHPCALKAVLIAERMGFFLEAPALHAPRH